MRVLSNIAPFPADENRDLDPLKRAHAEAMRRPVTTPKQLANYRSCALVTSTPRRKNRARRSALQAN